MGHSLQRRDKTEGVYIENFCTRKARFVVYNRPHVYIGGSIHINELHLKRIYYIIVLKDLMKLCGIWKAHDRPKVDDRKRSKCLIEAAKAICMRFKATEHKGL
jgi:hypothetical protein